MGWFGHKKPVTAAKSSDGIGTTLGQTPMGANYYANLGMKETVLGLLKEGRIKWMNWNTRLEQQDVKKMMPAIQNGGEIMQHLKTTDCVRDRGLQDRLRFGSRIDSGVSIMGVSQIAALDNGDGALPINLNVPTVAILPALRELKKGKVEVDAGMAFVRIGIVSPRKDDSGRGNMPHKCDILCDKEAAKIIYSKIRTVEEAARFFMDVIPGFVEVEGNSSSIFGHKGQLVRYEHNQWGNDFKDMAEARNILKQQMEVAGVE